MGAVVYWKISMQNKIRDEKKGCLGFASWTPFAPDASTCFFSSLCYGSTCYTRPYATAHQPQLSNQWGTLSTLILRVAKVYTFR